VVEAGAGPKFWAQTAAGGKRQNLKIHRKPLYINEMREFSALLNLFFQLLVVCQGIHEKWPNESFYPELVY